MRATVAWGVLVTILLSSAAGHAETAGSERRGEAPDLEYFFTPEK